MGCGRFPTPGIEPSTLESGTKALLRISLTYSVTTSVTTCIDGTSSSPVSSVGRASDFKARGPGFEPSWGQELKFKFYISVQLEVYLGHKKRYYNMRAEIAK